ncbi:glycosyl-4,4'-diaponeurosporenoate acyltransferase CrtO family protein [Hymenobacter metallicola]|uniref:Glycosyl-4,4'-diaponeurosporenoate acyltransferase n=1 Tax=Hymenobacter metallicola TaxID=2563114 RepID=A0A4Z0QDY4_9BACT|nr:hypothetical protein [Hymenobacter metallicola]TGE27706.1 hypothetical protein E5K02_15180 [Hymenobacter metallicola]
MTNSPKPALPSAAVLAGYNAVPSVLWSVLGLLPVSLFCYQHMARPWLCGLLGVSLLVYALPRAWFGWWQLSHAVRPYQRLGVPLVNLFTQHGGLVNALLRRRYPQYRHVRNRATLRALVTGSYHMERFHLALLVFFALASFYALGRGYAGWAALILVTNVGYNLYPVWLQQYLRLRLPTASVPRPPAAPGATPRSAPPEDER